MDKEIAKAFIFDATEGGFNGNTIYKSKDLQKLIDMNDGELYFIYAIIDTESGETLMNMDKAYDGEPIILGRFIHLDYFIKHYSNKQFIDLDKQIN